MKPQSSKAKGRRLQQAIVRDLLELHPDLTADDIRSTSMGAGGEDILLSSAARRALPYSFEAKNQERLNIWSALEQARANCPERCEPVVVFKKNQSKPYAALPWDALKLLISNREAPGAAESARECLLRLSRELQALAGTLPAAAP